MSTGIQVKPTIIVQKRLTFTKTLKYKLTNHNLYTYLPNYKKGENHDVEQ